MEEKIIKNEGSWIFISHSSKDIEKIRLIRNEFEKLGQNPLAFHLKCLNTDTEDNEHFLLELIKKEIEARNWFIYCESESAQNSKYVQLERDYVKQIGKDQIWKLNLNMTIDEIMEEINSICKKLQVFISYAIKDRYFVQNLIEELNKNDFSVWDDNSISLGSDLGFDTIVNNAIQSIARKGFFLCIMTENSEKSKPVWKELESAKQNDCFIIVLIFGNIISSTDKRFEGLLPIGKAPGGLAYRGVYQIPFIPKKEDMYLLSEIIYFALDRLRRNKQIRNTVYDWCSGTLDIENKIQEKLNYENKYHPEKPEHKGSGGAMLDYCEYFEFPCCGQFVATGDRTPSQYRADGCKNIENINKEK